MKMFEFRLKFHVFCSKVSNKQYSSIGSANDLAPSKRQAIVWSNAGILFIGAYMRHSVSMG